MAGFKKFTPKSQAVAGTTEKQERLTYALKMKEPDAERPTVLCFIRETTSKKNPNVKYFIGEVAARDEEGNVIKDPKTGWAQGSGSIFMLFTKKDGSAELVLRQDGDAKGEVVCVMHNKSNDKGMVFCGRDDDGVQWFIDKPLPKKPK